MKQRQNNQPRSLYLMKNGLPIDLSEHVLNTEYVVTIQKTWIPEIIPTSRWLHCLPNIVNIAILMGMKWLLNSEIFSANEQANSHAPIKPLEYSIEVQNCTRLSHISLKNGELSQGFHNFGKLIRNARDKAKLWKNSNSWLMLSVQKRVARGPARLSWQTKLIF